MGKVDVFTKEYMSNNVVFADAFNYFLYDGKQVVRPEKLRELDITEIAIPYGNKKEEAVQKFRDVLKTATMMADDQATYLILGIENESATKYAEPVKNGLYDFLQYSKQVQQTAAWHREAKDRAGHDDGEFLSGFYQEDRLTPVITLVILFDSDQWDGPRTLHEMMSVQDPDILKYVADYRINLIEPFEMEEDDLAKLRSSLRPVLGFIKYSKDSEELNAYLSKDSELKALDVRAARVIKVCANIDIQINEGEKVVDVCKAVQDMNEKARQEGLQEGLQTGRSEGRQEARLETLLADIKNAMEFFHVSLEEAMKGLKVTEEDRAILVKRI